MIPITRPYLGDEEANAAAEAIRSGWVTQGPRVAQFEQMVADYCHTTAGVAVTSCTTALHLSLLVAGIGAGDEVICPSMSFIATANAIRHARATPVFADVDSHAYNLDPDDCLERITPRTKAILVVHQIGLPAEIDRFRSIGRERGLTIIEDAACAIGSHWHGKPVGADSELTCFSFHPRKVISTGEGGMIVTNNAQHADRLRQLRQHGMTISDQQRHVSRQVVIEHYEQLGYNYRMTDIQAAVGIEQMKKLDEIVQRRRACAARYDRLLEPHPWLSTPFVPENVITNYQSYAVQLTDACPWPRNEIMQKLLDAGISTRRGIMLSHREPAYRGVPDEGLGRSIRASERSMLLPLFPQMSKEEQDHVVNSLFSLCSDKA